MVDGSFQATERVSGLTDGSPALNCDTSIGPKHSSQPANQPPHAGTDLLRRRTELGISLDELAEALNEHADQVRGYEQTPGNLPKSLARHLEYVLAVTDHEKRLEAAGLPQCAELKAIFAGLKPGQRKEVQRRIELADQHSSTCERCRAREAMLKTLPPLPPMPLPATMRFFMALSTRIEALPSMLRPAAWGAVLIGGMTMVRAVFFLVANPARPLQALWPVLAAVGIGAYGGAVGGVAYGVARPRTLRFGRLGDYLTGVICVFAYLFAFAIPLNLFTDDDTFRGTTSWIIFSVLALVFGIVLGHSVFKRDDAKSEIA